MKKIKKIIKNNIVGFIIGVIIAITISAYAATTLQSSAVYYDNSKSGGTSNTVSGAIDELYEKAKTTDFKAGDYVKMTPSSTSFTIPKTLTGYSSDQTINPSELNLWRVISINSNKTVEMVSQYVSTVNVHFYGKTGYQNYIGTLNYIAKQYENRKYTAGSRYMGYKPSIPEYITDTSKFNSMDSSIPINQGGTDNNAQDIDIMSDLGLLFAISADYGGCAGYFMASRGRNVTTPSAGYHIARRRCEYGDNNGNEIFSFNSNSNTFSETDVWYALRPIVILKSKIKASSGNGTSASPYVLS